ncbi:alpha/beta hydrolase [Pseudomonas sp. SLFW]|uniref:alpha/beta hydrolase n=1 Tax=Pseudomonas sp. SLFW TaxID=2683259 RepID=UPI00141288BC|nr:alpha/beta hydrolase [Pseudomonas sp. SLFW]NBB13325.1 alpha/beta hydrolase fold domain-containing protein [Pseudomonas sp. SLFW]
MPTEYPLSPEMALFIEKTLSFSVDSLEIPAQRRAYSRMCEAFTPTRPADLEVKDFQLAGVDVRCYRPHRISVEHPAPCVMYLHGGGWVVGDLDSHDFLTATLAVDLNAVVIAVDYRLAPEHPFPAGFEDCLEVWHALQIQAQRLDIDPQRIAIAGDSAGGNLAAAVCLALRDSGQRQPVGQTLIYPGLGGADDLPSRTECFDAPLLSTVDLGFYRQLYLSEGERSPYAMPLNATDFRGLAPAFIAVAQFDPLRDDGVCYERALREAGVATEFDPGLGLVHGSLRGKGQVAEVDALYRRLVSALLGFLRRSL